MNARGVSPWYNPELLHTTWQIRRHQTTLSLLLQAIWLRPCFQLFMWLTCKINDSVHPDFLSNGNWWQAIFRKVGATSSFHLSHRFNPQHHHNNRPRIVSFGASAFHDFRSITNLIVVSTMFIFCHLRNRNSFLMFLLDLNKIVHDFLIFAVITFSLCLGENIARSFILL